MPCPKCLTVLAPIKPGEAETLREILRANGDDIKGRRVQAGLEDLHIDFPESQRIHFARFAILSDPERGPGHTRLLFASVHDGDVESHLQEIVAITPDLDAIWGKCEGYGGADNFTEFIEHYRVESSAFYVAFRDQTVASIQEAISVRYETPPDARYTIASRARTRSVFGELRRVFRALPIVLDVLNAVLMSGLGKVVRAVKQMVAGLNRYTAVRYFNSITHNTMPPLQSRYSSATPDNCGPPLALAAGDEIPIISGAGPPTFREDVVAQNQLTLVTVVDPEHVEHVRAVLAAIDSYARRLSPPGSLIGVSTIHFVRWLLIDDGRRLMMVSDYDGSWENYIDEFAEMILSGLDAIWDTSYGYPPDGARDLPAFKRFLRNHQVPSELFFSAYPDATVLNVVEAIQ